MHGLRSIFGILTTALFLTMVLGGAAAGAKGVTWCVRDPIFVIDGRTVRVQDLVPVENATAPIHFVLLVAKSSKVTWHIPEGETMFGSVTIFTNSEISRNTPRLFVRGEGTAFPMRVNVSGSGLRTLPYEVEGTSSGISVALPLTVLPGDDDDDDDGDDDDDDDDDGDD